MTIKPEYESEYSKGYREGWQAAVDAAALRTLPAAQPTGMREQGK